ncbi:hypothetical protein EVAR_87882_1 [Eumeta japonica]|uniref:Uncharacterized protein n=1 Tax=Eumeta variegata TaxID=151549 RepID=A0A4C1WXA5_EUMVA|nr:hypothetical protein EVAR_87882_1 [Eumeta japonica]
MQFRILPCSAWSCSHDLPQLYSITTTYKTLGPPETGGPKRAPKSLPLGSASSANSREQSPSPSVCGGKRTSRAILSGEGLEQSNTTVKGTNEEEQEDLSFKIIQRKRKKVSRRLRKSSN